MTLFQDANLVGFWPLITEPSGTAVYRNFAPSGIAKPSGISFDLHTHIVNADVNQPQSWWPGNQSMINPESGVIYTGLKLQGSGINMSINIGTTEDKAGTIDKVLTLGNGTFANRHVCVPPNSAQSGFTVGFWVNPQSDGVANIISKGTANMTNAVLSSMHALVAKADLTSGFYIGISGKQNKATQFNSDPNNFQLVAYAHVLNNSRHLTIPIESGRYTHLTFVYRNVTGANQVSLWKDGRLSANDRTTASGTAASNLNDSNPTYRDRLLTVGGGQNSTITDRYTVPTGWGHLISGLYIFSRPLHDGEIGLLHDQGGFQPDFNSLKPLTPININDPSIITYVPMVSPGYVDVSSKHYVLFSDQDEGVNANMLIAPGPFNRSMAFNNSGGSTALGIASGSGLVTDALLNGSFTIAAQVHSNNTSSLDQNTFCSFGSIGSVEGGPGSLGSQTMGFFISTSGAGGVVHDIARIARGGDSKSQLTLKQQDKDKWLATTRHMAFVYDDQTFGCAFYINGALAESGNLASSMLPQNLILAGKGYPLVFLNGVPTTVTDTFSLTGGDSGGTSDIFVANRPLLESEIRFLAQSGIDITPLYLTPQDPRLRGYWKCTDATHNDFIIQDRARVWGGNGIPGNLVRCTSDVTWDLIEASDTKSAFYKQDYFKNAIDSTFGITSGTWSVMGASDGTHEYATQAANRRTSANDLTQRFRPMSEARSTRSPSFINDLVWSFEVTPSGNIPNTYTSVNQEFNSLLVEFGDGDTNNGIHSFLTTINNGQGLSSGVCLVWMARDTNTAPNLFGLGSGILVSGLPNRVLLHAKPLTPNKAPGNANEVIANPIQFDLYISGIRQQRIIAPSNTSLYYSDGTFTPTADDWFTIIGGRDLDDDFSTHSTRQGGLGNNYLRNIFCMVGNFHADEIQYLANSGLLDTSPYSNYSDTIPTSMVTNGDTGLQGYWRFSGDASGTLDFSTKGNNLIHLARTVAEGNLFTNKGSNTAMNLRYVPALYGPGTSSPIAGRASGITLAGTTPTSVVSPFVVSGTIYDTPTNGFSVGFWLCQRASVGVGTADYIMGYGRIPAGPSTTTNVDASWGIFVDQSNSVKLIMSTNGTIPYDNHSTTNGLAVCAIYRDTGLGKLDNVWDVAKKGFFDPGHIDSWQHFIWSYDSATSIVKGYLNGILVNQQIVPPGFRIPTAPESRIINFLVPMTNNWVWDSTSMARDEVLSDVFYMSRSISDSEAASISLNGFMTAASASGMIGGYIAGQDVVSGVIGGYADGIDIISGLIGGYVATTALSSGIVGGYTAGQDSLSGIVGGYLESVVIVSGFIGGYLNAKNLISGVIGGYLNSALTSTISFDAKFTVGAAASKDFDAFIEIQRTSHSDFDAQIILFEEELPPGVDIIVPNTTVSGVSIPFKQYFIGSGTAVQGKTISQATWDWGDLTPTESAFASGINGDLYPGNHIFQSSGFYIVRFTIYDSNGIQNTASRIIDCSSGITPVLISLSGNPRFGPAPLQVQFSQVFESIPTNVSILSSLLKFDDMTSTNTFGALHTYSEPGIYVPIWIVKDSRGVIWGDSLEVGVNG